jgi:hypothetical protein
MSVLATPLHTGNETFVSLCCCDYDRMQVLHPQSMRPAREGDIPVRVKNSYNPKAPGTLITKEREMDKVSRFLKIYSHIRTCDSRD